MSLIDNWNQSAVGFSGDSQIDSAADGRERDRLYSGASDDDDGEMVGAMHSKGSFSYKILPKLSRTFCRRTTIPLMCWSELQFSSWPNLTTLTGKKLVLNGIGSCISCPSSSCRRCLLGDESQGCSYCHHVCACHHQQRQNAIVASAP